ncbi:ribonuclease H-like domain-containing protein [Tanacetum coccineum]
MVTRSKVGIVKANPKYNLHVTTSSPIPKSPFHALRDPNWKQAMCDEYKAIFVNNTWDYLIPGPTKCQHCSALCGWNQQYIAGESLKSVQKLRLVASGRSQPTSMTALAGSLQYLTFIRPDLSYAIQQLCLYMHDPREPHLNAMKRVLRYLRGTTDLGLQLFWSTTSQLIAYSDADWAGCPATRRSTSGYCVFLGDNLLTWSSKRQDTLSRSSAEAEYRGVVNAVAEASWIRNLLRELHTPLFTATLVYCDNGSAVYMSANPV